MQYTIRQLQLALNKLPTTRPKLVVDGLMGRNTERAIVTLKAAHGLRKRPHIGPLTFKLIFGDKTPDARSAHDPMFPPWLNEISRYMGHHEVRDNARLRRWLKSDGQALGDPAKFPWCGDAVQTAIRLTLPNEPFPGALGQNPYWARNWNLFGVKSSLNLGCVIVKIRKGGGHVAFAVGFDPKRNRIRIRGGNQSNMINDTWTDAVPVENGGTLLGVRRPMTWQHKLPQIPIMNSKGAVVSENEAFA